MLYLYFNWSASVNLLLSILCTHNIQRFAVCLHWKVVNRVQRCVHFWSSCLICSLARFSTWLICFLAHFVFLYHLWSSFLIENIQQFSSASFHLFQYDRPLVDVSLFSPLTFLRVFGSMFQFDFYFLFNSLYTFFIPNEFNWIEINRLPFETRLYCTASFVKYSHSFISVRQLSYCPSFLSSSLSLSSSSSFIGYS